MKEQELNTLMSVVSDPIENVYKIESYKDLAEIQIGRAHVWTPVT